MHEVGAHFEALDEGVLLAPLDCRYTQVGFNLVSVQVCNTEICVNILYQDQNQGIACCIMQSWHK